MHIYEQKSFWIQATKMGNNISKQEQERVRRLEQQRLEQQVQRRLEQQLQHFKENQDELEHLQMQLTQLQHIKDTELKEDLEQQQQKSEKRFEQRLEKIEQNAEVTIAFMMNYWLYCYQMQTSELKKVRRDQVKQQKQMDKQQKQINQHQEQLDEHQKQLSMQLNAIQQQQNHISEQQNQLAKQQDQISPLVQVNNDKLLWALHILHTHTQMLFIATILLMFMLLNFLSTGDELQHAMWYCKHSFAASL